MRTNRLVALALVLMLALGAASVGCTATAGGAEDYTIKIEGDEGVQYEGQYLYFEEAAPLLEEFSGEVPATLEKTAEQMSVSVTKTGGEGELRVEVLADGEVVDSQSVSENGKELRMFGD